MPLHKHRSHLSIPSLATVARRSLRHFPRGTTSHGLSHTTVLVIAISASVGGLLLILVLWFILSRRSARSRSVPFPQRQALVHQRERQLVAFTEHQNASFPNLLPDDRSRLPSVKYVGDSLRDTLNATSSSNHEVDERTAPPSFFEGHLQPPTPPFLTSRTPPNASSTSLPLPYGRSTPSPDGTLPPDSIFPSSDQSLKRAADRSGPRRRPLSMGSFDTAQTTANGRSRSSIRAAPHAPHSNIQIMLPAPLAPNLYERLSSEEPRMRKLSRAESVYTDSGQTSLVDTWVSIGQHDVPEPGPIERQRRESMERSSRRLMRRGQSPMSTRPRSRSNSSPHLSRTSEPSPDGHSKYTQPPVPRVPSKYGTLSGQHLALPPTPESSEHLRHLPAPVNYDHSVSSRAQ